MPTLGELLRGHGDIAAADLDWLHRLVAEWQLLADLSFADLLLTIPVRGESGFVVVAHIRPTTGPTAYQEDRVGEVVRDARRPQLRVAFAEGRIAREGDPVWVDGVPVREEAIPVRRSGEILAVVGRDTNLAAARTPSRLEIAYLQSANDLAQMVAEGRFPVPGSSAADDAGPRVGDGFVRLDETGQVQFASPNAQSAFRRLGFAGDLSGRDLAEVTAALTSPGDSLEEPAGAVATGRFPRTADVEARGATVQLRAIPLHHDERHIGAVLLVHDVSELRRRDRALLSKDATIREIHHRVKNNLQTVAALLRLQARRLDSPEARLALAESVRRVSSIAIVHETLALTLDEAVPFDAIADRLLAMVGEVGAGESRAELARVGSFGVLPAAVATPLAMVVNELLHNAAEHAFRASRPGHIEVRTERVGSRLRLAVLDDGRGLPEGFQLDASNRLGLQIVRTLVEGELGGVLRLEARPEGGTQATVDVPLPPPVSPAPGTAADQR